MPWPAVQSQSPRHKHHVGSLQSRVPQRFLDKLRVVHIHIAHGGVVWKQPGQLVVELQIIGDDDRDGSGHRLLYVPSRKRWTEALLCSRGTNEYEPRGTVIRARGPKFQRVAATTRGQ